jgi:predicted MPP superfamily phosphohydrolase
MALPRVDRRTFLKGTLLAGAAAALPAIAEGQTPTLVAEEQLFLVPGLDPSHDGLKVAQLSDLHVGARTPVETIRAAIATANAFQPDLVLLTGDFVGRQRSDVEAMRDQLGGLSAPTVAVLGNHDHWVDAAGAADALRGHGYEVLENAWTSLTLRGAPLPVVGVGDLRTAHEDVARATRGLPPGAAPVVLTHCPGTADRLQALERPALCFAGHTHGGQVVLPILTPTFMYALKREFYPRGRYRLGQLQLYVNRGVGNSAFRIRINCPPEVTLATLRAA